MKYLTAFLQEADTSPADREGGSDQRDKKVEEIPPHTYGRALTKLTKGLLSVLSVPSPRNTGEKSPSARYLATFLQEAENSPTYLEEGTDKTDRRGEDLPPAPTGETHRPPDGPPAEPQADPAAETLFPLPETAARTSRQQTPRKTPAATVEVLGAPLETPPFAYITESSQLAAALPEILAAPVTGVDTETTGLDPLSDKIRLLQVSTPAKTYVIDLFTVPWQPLVPFFASDRVMSMQNGKFDLKFLTHRGVPCPTGHIHDTMLASQLLGAGTTDGMLNHCGLSALTARMLGKALPKDAQTSNWAIAELTAEQIAYAAKDAYAARLLYEERIK